MADKTDKPAEFDSDEQRDAYVAALETEAAHLAEIAEAGHLTDEQRAVKKRRAGDVAGELKRVKGASRSTRLRGEDAETR